MLPDDHLGGQKPVVGFQHSGAVPPLSLTQMVVFFNSVLVDEIRSFPVSLQLNQQDNQILNYIGTTTYFEVDTEYRLCAEEIPQGLLVEG
jgi:hypothetical protein